MSAVSERRPLLKIEHLCKDFKVRSGRMLDPPATLHALSDVSLEVYPGETLGIIGESGCGKSTLGRCIVGLHKVTSGSIAYDGEDITQLKGAAKKNMHRNIQMIFQDPYSSLDSRMTCGKSVAEPMIIHGLMKDRDERDKKALELMKKVGMDVQHFYRYPHELSGGQRQRINIARALALDPKLIVCDEPISALDVSIQAQVLNLFSEIQEEFGLTYLFISHDLSVIRYISDRIAIMYLGQVVELCSAKEIYESPLHPYTQALLSAVPPASPFDQKEQIELIGEISSPIGRHTGCSLQKRCRHCTKRCCEETPELKEVSPGHYVSCFLAEK